MTTAELMAVAVLKGDTGAARALADSLCEQWNAGGVEVRAVKVGTGKVRAVVYAAPDATSDEMGYAGLRHIPDWLESGGALVMPHGWRIDLYEFPESPA